MGAALYNEKYIRSVLSYKSLVLKSEKSVKFMESEGGEGEEGEEVRQVN